MFDSVLDRGVVPRRRLAAGAVVSVFGHATVLSLAMLVRPPQPVPEQPQAIIWPTVAPMFTPAPVPAGGSTTPTPPRPRRQKRDMVVPAVIPPPIPDLVPPPDVNPDPEIVTGNPIGDTGTPPGGSGGPEGPLGPSGGPGGTAGGTCTGGACNFEEHGMTKPVLLDRGGEPTYTHEAQEARVQGDMTVQCVVTLEGRLEQCRALRSLPFMERAVVEALRTRRYAPATLGGRPLAVRYVFHVRLELPH